MIRWDANNGEPLEILKRVYPQGGSEAAAQALRYAGYKVNSTGSIRTAAKRFGLQAPGREERAGLTYEQELAALPPQSLLHVLHGMRVAFEEISADVKRFGERLNKMLAEVERRQQGRLEDDDETQAHQSETD